MKLPSQSYGTLLAIWEHSVLPATQRKWIRPVLAPASSQYSTYLPLRDGRLSWPRWLVTYRDGLPAHRWSPIQVLTRQCTAGSWTLTCWSQVRFPNHYTAEPAVMVLCLFWRTATVMVVNIVVHWLWHWHGSWSSLRLRIKHVSYWWRSDTNWTDAVCKRFVKFLCWKLLL